MGLLYSSDKGCTTTLSNNLNHINETNFNQQRFDNFMVPYDVSSKYNVYDDKVQEVRDALNKFKSDENITIVKNNKVLFSDVDTAGPTTKFKPVRTFTYFSDLVEDCMGKPDELDCLADAFQFFNVESTVVVIRDNKDKTNNKNFHHYDKVKVGNFTIKSMHVNKYPNMTIIESSKLE